jgi:hypothetical protein
MDSPSCRSQSPCCSAPGHQGDSVCCPPSAYAAPCEQINNKKAASVPEEQRPTCVPLAPARRGCGPGALPSCHHQPGVRPGQLPWRGPRERLCSLGGPLPDVVAALGRQTPGVQGTLACRGSFEPPAPHSHPGSHPLASPPVAHPPLSVPHRPAVMLSCRLTLQCGQPQHGHWGGCCFMPSGCLDPTMTGRGQRAHCIICAPGIVI